MRVFPAAPTLREWSTVPMYQSPSGDAPVPFSGIVDALAPAVASTQAYLWGSVGAPGTAGCGYSPCKVAGDSRLVECSWVPDDLQKPMLTPVGLSQWALPVVIAARKGAMLFKPVALPFVGLAKVIHVLDGEFTAWLIPGSVFSDMMVSVADIDTWLSAVKPPEFVRRSARWPVVRLVKGSTLWVPAGWAYGLVCTAAGCANDTVCPATAVLAPYACPGLYKCMTPTVHEWVRAGLISWSALPTCGVWGKPPQEALSWFESLPTPALAPNPELACLEDGSQPASGDH